MPEPILHGGCFYCGTEKQPVLKGFVKPVIDAKGKQDAGRSVALCDECAKFPLLDFRVQTTA